MDSAQIGFDHPFSAYFGLRREHALIDEHVDKQLFQSFNRRAGRHLDAYLGTFILLAVSAVVLALASVLTEDLSQLRSVPLRAFVNFGLAGFIHFFLGWTFISLSQLAFTKLSQ